MTARTAPDGTAYDVWGTGDPPLVLVHGFMGGRTEWAAVQAELAAQRRVFAYDLRGHGGSATMAGPPGPVLDRLVADLVALTDGLTEGPVDLLGHSLGGVVGMRFALDHPHRLRSLLLSSTSAAPAGPLAPAVVQRLGELGRTKGMSAVADLLDRVAVRPGAPRTPEQRARVRAGIAAMDVDVFTDLWTAMSAYDSLLDALRRVEVPVTVLFGEHDLLADTECRAIAAVVPGARLAVIEGAGHTPHEENPVAWLTAVREHFAVITRPGRPTVPGPDLCPRPSQ